MSAAPLPVHQRTGVPMDQSQQPPPYPAPGEGMPRVVRREQARQIQESYYPQAWEPPPQPWADWLYEMLWPVGSWCVILIQIAFMVSTLLAMITKYDWMNHASVTLVSVIAFGALAAIHRYWVTVQPKPAETSPPPQ